MNQEILQIKQIIDRAVNIENKTDSLLITIGLDQEILSWINKWDSEQKNVDNTVLITIQSKTLETSIDKLSNYNLGEEIKLSLLPELFEIFKYRTDFYPLRWQKFLNSSPAEKPFYIDEDKRLYLIELEEPDFFSKMRQWDQIKEIVTNISDYIITHGCILFKKRKLEILFAFISDMINAEIEGTLITEILKDLESDDNKEERISIFKSVLEEFLYNHPAEKRFAYLLNNFKQIYHSYKYGYDLYLEQFSYEKLKTEFKEDNVEYLKRIGEALDHIKNQVLIISTEAVAISQIDFLDPINIKTILIAAVVLLATIIYSFVLHNQHQTLKDINEEIKDKQRTIKEKQPGLYERDLKKGFENLKNRIYWQLIKIIIFTFILWSIPIAIIVALIFHELSKDPGCLIAFIE